MAKSSRRNATRTSDRNSRSSSAARSRSVSNMASSQAGFPAWQSEVSSEPRRSQPRRALNNRPHQGRPRSLQALFGTWELPPPPRPQAKASEAVSTCVARHQRKEVLFATKRTGIGSRSPKTSFNNRRCK